MNEGEKRQRVRPLGWMPGDSPLPLAGSRARRRSEEQRPPASGEGRASSGGERWQLLARGRVQGVGYRLACQRRATDLGLGGWVRNRPDGSVEVEAEGDAKRLEELRLWCERGPAGASVRSVTVSRIPPNGVDWFEIRR